MWNKTTIKEFIKYLEEYDQATTRLITVLKKIESSDYFIEDIKPKEFSKFRGAGKKTSAEFDELKSMYKETQYKEHGYDKMTREELLERIRELWASLRSGS